MSSFWNNKRVLVTGGCGFIGSHLAGSLVRSGAGVTVMDNLSNGRVESLGGLKDHISFIEGDCRDAGAAYGACRREDVVMNLAAKVSDVSYNAAHPATMLRENLQIQTTMIDAARRAGVKQFLIVSSAVVYPADCTIPTPETEGFTGFPDNPNKGYGWAKRVNELLGSYYHEEYGMETAIVRPYNCYGPGDHFFPTPSHVVPSLIRRVIDGENPVVVWGSGKQTRAFLYVDDLVRGMMLATEKYACADPVNLGTDEEVTIRELVEAIIRLSGKEPQVRYDTDKPDGSPRRNSDNRKAREKLGFRAETSLEEGLRKTIEWYRAQIPSA
ncbi:NAD-dependent epimerase/dehydratase family protein [Patescibacteria group bacterium]|nr:NAD-dependent epimerase/dehydratase family protein [Patescibacteria group bacterium]